MRREEAAEAEGHTRLLRCTTEKVSAKLRAAAEAATRERRTRGAGRGDVRARASAHNAGLGTAAVGRGAEKSGDPHSGPPPHVDLPSRRRRRRRRPRRCPSCARLCCGRCWRCGCAARPPRVVSIRPGGAVPCASHCRPRPGHPGRLFPPRPPLCGKAGLLRLRTGPLGSKSLDPRSRGGSAPRSRPPPARPTPRAPRPPKPPLVNSFAFWFRVSWVGGGLPWARWRRNARCWRGESRGRASKPSRRPLRGHTRLRSRKRLVWDVSLLGRRQGSRAGVLTLRPDRRSRGAGCVGESGVWLLSLKGGGGSSRETGVAAC